MFPTDCNKVRNRLMIIHLRVASLLSLDDLEDEGVLGEDPEHVDDAGHYPGLHCGQALRL